MSINELPLEVVSLDTLVPVGIPQYYPGDVLPSNRFEWAQGAEFDKEVLVELAKLYPSGFLPDTRYDFFRVVGDNEPALVKHEQSVQPLTFIGNALPNHAHNISTNRDGGDKGSNITSTSTGGNPLTRGTHGASAGTPTGKIGGTGAKTAPQHMDWHCIIRTH